MNTQAEQSIRDGNLKDALSQLQQSVRDNPARVEHRIFLFQLLCVLGDWNRALTQLNVAADMDSEALLMAQTYRELLQCESYRSAVFDGQRAPLVFGQPPVWMGLLIQSLSASASGNGEQAKALVERAFEQADLCPGTLDGERFDWLADADMRLGPVFEAIINGRYYWIPMQSVASVSVSAPEDLRDLVWLPVQFKWINGGENVGFVPSRYPGADTLQDAQCAMARKTEWADLGNEFFVGSGQRTWSTETGDYPLLQVRELVFDARAASDDGAG